MDATGRIRRAFPNLVDKALPAALARAYCSSCPKGPQTDGASAGGNTGPRSRSLLWIAGWSTDRAAVPSGVSLCPTRSSPPAGPGLAGEGRAGATGLTLYIFTEDVKDSGESVCTGECLVTWPALTVAAGETPTGGEGVTGALGTITRTDDNTLQVTYNGLPLYFFKNDTAPGDANGVYEKWEVVEP